MSTQPYQYLYPNRRHVSPRPADHGPARLHFLTHKPLVARARAGPFWDSTAAHVEPDGTFA